MFDSHEHFESWGILPYIKIGENTIPTYSLMITIGLILGVLLLKFLKKDRDKEANNDAVFIIMTALTTATLGAKIPIWFMNYKSIIGPPFSLELFLSGRTVVGGFIGGMFGVILVKKILGRKERWGNLLAAPIALGMIFGRSGCLLRGCCYGTCSTVPWALDFGDNLLRHPTQVYEMIFHFILMLYLLKVKAHKVEGGRYLSFYFISYLAFRFITEFIRIHDVIVFGMTYYQIASLVGIVAILLKEYIRGKQKV